MATFCGSKCFEPLNLAYGGENDRKFSGVAKGTESSCEEKPPKFISGEVPIRLIAPPVVPENEKNTNLLAEIAVNELGCHAIINDSVNRKKRDYNEIDEASQDFEFINAVKSFVGENDPALVVRQLPFGVLVYGISAPNFR